MNNFDVFYWAKRSRADEIFDAVGKLCQGDDVIFEPPLTETEKYILEDTLALRLGHKPELDFSKNL